MKKERNERKVLYVHGSKRFISHKGEILGYDNDLLISLKKRYSYLGADIQFIQFGIQLNEQKNFKLINLEEQGIKVIPIPYCLSPPTFKHLKEAKKIIYDAVYQCDILIARMPSYVSYIAQDAALLYGKPYLIEVVACTWGALWNHSNLTKLYAPYSFFKCKKSIAKGDYVTYVSQKYLQKRYPNYNKTCSISDVFLKEVSGELIEKRIQRLSIDHPKFVITTLGAVDVLYKGQHFVIEAIAKLKKKGYLFEYHIAGDGDQTRLRKIAERFGVSDQVVFEGMLNPDQVNALLDKTDIYIQPSLQEGLPRAVVEAMSRGCATLGAKTGGIPELVNSDFLFKKRDITAIVNLLIQFAENKKLLIKASIENFNQSKDFKGDILDRRRKDFYDQFIEENFTKKNRVFITPAHTNLNRGDQSLTWESIHLVKEIIPDSEIYLFRSSRIMDDCDNQSSLSELYEYKCVSRILPFPLKGKSKGFNYSIIQLLRSGFGGVKNLIASRMLLSKYSFLNRLSDLLLLDKEQSKSYKLFIQADYVFVKGGGFLHSYGNILDGYISYFFLFDVLLAQRLGKKVFVLPNSIGPLINKTAQQIIIKNLSKCELLSVREPVSERFLQNLGLSPLISPDLGFYLKPSNADLKGYLEKYGVDFSKRRIAINMRPYRFYGSKQGASLYRNYIHEFGKLIQCLSDKNYQISLIAHTLGPSNHENDGIALKDVMNTLSKELLQNIVYLEDNKMDCHQIAKLYSYYDILIGTRFHSVIFALNVDVTAIAIAYGGNKTNGIMYDIGISDYVVPIEKVSADHICSMVDKIEQNRNEYLEKVRSYKEKLVVERTILRDYIKNRI